MPAEHRCVESQRRAEQISHAIYGTIIVTALLVTLQDHGFTADEVIAAIVSTAVALFFAHVYASGLGRRMVARRRPERTEVKALVVDNLPLLVAVLSPILVLVLAAAGLFSVETALTIAIAVGLVSLFAMGFGFGKTTDHGLPASLGLGVSSAGAGAVIVALESALH